jgi:hypothetical protein
MADFPNYTIPKAGDTSPVDWGDAKRAFTLKEQQEVHRDKIRLKVLTSTWSAGMTGQIEVTVRPWEADGQSMSAGYNPFFSKFVRPPSYALAVFDKDKKFAMDLAWCGAVGKRLVRYSDFLSSSVPITGAILEVATKRPGDNEPPYEYPRLPIGEWKLQIILFDRFVPYPQPTFAAPIPPADRKPGEPDRGTFGFESDHHDEAVEYWLRCQTGKELARSNVVDVAVVAAQQ